LLFPHHHFALTAQFFFFAATAAAARGLPTAARFLWGLPAAGIIDFPQ
jgi:hypothetical protein